MSPDEFFYLILLSNWTVFLFNLVVSYRQYKVCRDNVTRPDHIKDIMNEELYQKTRDYQLEKRRFSFVREIILQCQSTAVLWYGVLPFFWNYVSSLSVAGALFYVCIMLFDTVCGIPFDIYDTFVIENRFGFNKQTFGFYVVDKLKKLLLTIIITIPLVCAVEFIVTNGGDYFVLYAWIFMSVVVFLLIMIYPEFIAPLFDKYISLPDGELRVAIEKLAESLGFPLKKLFVVHGSKRSAHSNAYMYGFCNNKRIVLFDTLLSGDELKKVVEQCGVSEEEQKEALKSDRGMKKDEVVGVLGHELGHWQLMHTVINIVVTELAMLISFAMFGFLYKYDVLYKAFGFGNEMPVVVGLVLVLSHVMMVLGYALNIMSRKFEFDADNFAVNLGYGEPLIRALIKLCEDNLSFLVDDPLYAALNHSHPSVPERVKAIKNSMKRTD